MISNEHINIIKSSWEKVIASDLDMPKIFYQRLFQTHPKIRPFFKSDIQLQYKKLVAHLSYIIDNLDNWHVLEEQLSNVAHIHQAYGVSHDDYKAGVDALIYSLTCVLEKDWSERLEVAYLALYWKIVIAMTDVTPYSTKHPIASK